MWTNIFYGAVEVLVGNFLMFLISYKTLNSIALIQVRPKLWIFLNGTLSLSVMVGYRLINHEITIPFITVFVFSFMVLSGLSANYPSEVKPYIEELCKKARIASIIGLVAGWFTYASVHAPGP
jgi:hypothetical protein